MKKIFICLLALALFSTGSVRAGDNAPWLKSDIYYYLAVDQDVFVLPWLLAWEGTIQGDVNGVIRYWLDVTSSFSPDYVTRWEVLACPTEVPKACPHDEPGLVIMAGYSAGTNFEPEGVVIEWGGKGLVTFVTPPYEKWFGRRTTEGGWYILGEVTDGWGTFMIYDRPSNKH